MVLSLCCSLLFFFFPQESIENTHLLDAALALLEKKAFIKKNTA